MQAPYATYFSTLKHNLQNKLDQARNATSAYDVLGFSEEEVPTLTWENIQARFNRYQRYCHPENFLEVQDEKLKQLASDLQREYSQAFTQIKESLGNTSETDYLENTSVTSTVDADARALAMIFFDDGMAYLRLGDLLTACTSLKRATTLDPTQGLFLAYHAYSVFRRDSGQPDIVQKTLKILRQAVKLSPKDADVYLIIARFHLKCRDLEAAERAIRTAKQISPHNPNIVNVDRTFFSLLRKMKS